MNILFLCHRVPYPPNKGDKIRSFNEIKHLSKNHNIFLGTILDQKHDQGYLKHLRAYCKDIYAVHFNKKIGVLKHIFSDSPFTVSSFYDRRLQRYVDETLKAKQIDAVICFCSSMAEYIFNNPAYRTDGLKDVILIQDFVDLDSDKWLQYARYTSYPRSLIYKTENRRLFRYEVKINKAFDYSVFVAQREVDIFKTMYPQAKNIRVIPNGVSTDYFQPKHELIGARKKKESVLVFTGMMNYFANEDGVRWFCKDIFPHIRSSIPEAQFYIVGNRPTHTVRKLGRKHGVKVTGYVDDIRDYYRIADICVIPLRIARGLQNKVLEAMAAGNAVVATSNASDGISCSNDEDIVIANDSKTFADQVISLLNDPERCKILGQNAVKNIRKNYNWDTNLKAFDSLLRSKKSEREK